MACQCSSPLFICHVEVGCLCPPGEDCHQRLERSEDSQRETEMLARLWHHMSLVIALPVSVILLVVLSLLCCLVVYYNLKFKKMKSLIVNRNVVYNSSAETSKSKNQNKAELECSEDRKSITSLSQVLSLYTDRQQDPDQQTFSDSSERSSQLTVGSVSSQDTTLDMEIPNYQDYDHLDHTRSVNDMSPNYCQY